MMLRIATLRLWENLIKQPTTNSFSLQFSPSLWVVFISWVNFSFLLVELLLVLRSEKKWEEMWAEPMKKLRPFKLLLDLVFTLNDLWILQLTQRMLLAFTEWLFPTPERHWELFGCRWGWEIKRILVSLQIACFSRLLAYRIFIARRDVGNSTFKFIPSQQQNYTTSWWW